MSALPKRFTRNLSTQILLGVFAMEMATTSFAKATRYRQPRIPRLGSASERVRQIPPDAHNHPGLSATEQYI